MVKSRTIFGADRMDESLSAQLQAIDPCLYSCSIALHFTFDEISPRRLRWHFFGFKFLRWTGNCLERPHESSQIVGIRWAVGVQRCTDADDCVRRDLGQDQEYRRQSSGSCRGLRNTKTD